MRVSPISVNYLSNKQRVIRRTNQGNPVETVKNQLSPNFRGNGALWGMAGGFLGGAIITTAVVLTGGLAGVVAAVGAGATCIGGGAACTELGGIAGGLIEGYLDEKDAKERERAKKD